MTVAVSHTLVLDMLAMQGLDSTPEAARRIATALTAQLAVAAPAYARLAFEDEPAGYAAVLAAESR